MTSIFHGNGNNISKYTKDCLLYDSYITHYITYSSPETIIQSFLLHIILTPGITVEICTMDINCHLNCIANVSAAPCILTTIADNVVSLMGHQRIVSVLFPFKLKEMHSERGRTKRNCYKLDASSVKS